MVDEKQNDRPKTLISPMLSVRNGARAVEFYRAAFGAETLFRLDGPDGGVVAQLAVDGSQFWVADESPEHSNFSPESLGGGTVRMVMVVESPDAAFERAVKAGAKIVVPVEDQPYGWRVGRVMDPFGHHWEIGRPLTNAS
jgi:PhnB protein